MRKKRLARRTLCCLLPALVVISGILVLLNRSFLDPVTTDAPEKIAFAKFDPVWDFGEVTQGDKLTATFPVTNIGNKRLTLNQLGSSCECARGNQDTIIVQPGDTTELVATVDTSKLEGSFRMEVDYATSAPDSPRFKLLLYSKVIPSCKNKLSGNER